MEKIRVVGAAVVEGGKVLALRRAKGTAETVHKLEFAGGKIENGESPVEALIRECREELSAEIDVGALVHTVNYDYPEFSVTLSVYYARLLTGFTLSEHEEALWLDCSSLEAADWAPADRDIVNILKRGELALSDVAGEEEYAALTLLADRILAETAEDGSYDRYVLEKLRAAAAERCAEDGVLFHIVRLNGEDVGFYMSRPSDVLGSEYPAGTFLSGIYMLSFARGKKIFSRVLPMLRYPVYVSVSRSDARAISIYKHSGFKVVDSVNVPAEGGAAFENFIMSLS